MSELLALQCKTVFIKANPIMVEYLILCVPWLTAALELPGVVF